MNGRSLAMLGVAILCGLGAMYGTSKMLAKGKTGPVVEMQDVIVASHDLKIEEVVKPDAIKVVRMARSAVPGGAFTSAKDVEDRWVQIGMLEGEPILDRKLAARGTPPGLVARIPKGMRAFAVEVNEQTGVSGFILPDHRVDVVQIEPNPSSSRAEAETVLQDVLVLASGQTFTRPDDRSIQARTVTLAVGPDQVDSLVAARSRGPLSLSLRGLNDHTRTSVKVVKKAEPATPPPAPEPPAAVAAPAPAPPPVAVKPPDPLPVIPRVRSVLVHRGLRRSERVRLSPAPDDEQDGAPAPAAEAEAAAEGSVRRN